MIKFIAVLLMVISFNAFGFEGLVTSVHDGDTLTAKNENGLPEKVRIYRIDAPELKAFYWSYQPYASESRTGLMNLCLGKVALITRKSKDQYGRTVGIVNCDGKDVATEQIINGRAWAYRYTATKAMKKAQLIAKDSKVGLWGLDNPVEPILWRKQTK
jgi:endonuclease YncB( thermonuclease family)